jgi:hypothetical protein
MIHWQRPLRGTGLQIVQTCEGCHMIADATSSPRACIIRR